MKMTNLFLLATASALFFACNPSTQTADAESGTATDSVTTAKTDTTLTAQLTVPQVVGTDGPIESTFTVYNRTDSSRTFCKWHTPFEPLMSKYLDVKADGGAEVAYKGPMAKRIMPPPAESYLSVKPGDSLSVKFDLRKAYDLQTPGNYTIRYNAEGISGLKVIDSVKLVVKP